MCCVLSVVRVVAVRNCWLLFVVRCLCFVVRYVSFVVVGCLLFVGYWLLSVWCWCVLLLLLEVVVACRWLVCVGRGSC